MHLINTFFKSSASLSFKAPLQQTTIKKKAVALKKFEFVDFVRFISMVGVVWMHCYLTPNGRDKFTAATDHPLLFIFSVQFLKFSSICFFIISGFLLCNKMTVEDGFHFYKKRFHALWKPYITAFFIAFCYCLLKFFLQYNVFQPFQLANNIVFHTGFWFVPNLLFSLLIIILLLKTTTFFNSGIITGLLLLINTIYTVYLSKEEHTIAFFAYAFYIWLGMFFYKKNIIEKVRSLKTLIILAAFLCSFLLASAESYFFAIHHPSAAITFNSLCFTNQLYSIIAFLFLIRISNYVPAFTFLNPRKETFGIYLYHLVVISIVFTVIEAVQHVFQIKLYSFNTYPTLLLTFINFAICYSLSTLLVKYLISKNLFFLARE